jgi:16S rRNA (adenine1518-N6/adenine1519-N6)-dimethyltransferase
LKGRLSGPFLSLKLFDILIELRMHAKKRYGQNFLQSEIVAKRIVNSLNLNKDDIIIEVGPGLGALTKFLYQHEGYIGIEIDGDLVEKLKAKFEGINVKNRDFLSEDLDIYDNPKYIGNLPYYVVSSIIFKILKTNFLKAVFMVQKEVAQRIVSPPKNRAYGFLSVIVQYYCNVKYLFEVKNTSFYPVPKVHSAVVEFYRNKIIYNEGFTIFLKRAFSMKRKTLINNLKAYYSRDRLNDVFKKLNISVNSRAEELQPTILRSIFDALD